MPRSNVVPLIRGAAKKLDKLERSQLETVYEQQRAASSEWIRRQVLENNRIDILAKMVLGYQIEPFHLAMMQWQFLHPDNLQMAFRGSGKTTVCTIARAVFMLCKNRNLRILLGSKSKGNAEGFLRGIKAHFEHNKKLAETFGPFFDPREVDKWDNSEISVLGRTSAATESSITCTGEDSSITSKHFDVLITDDLITEENSRTPRMREKTQTWYYKTYCPLLEPPDPTMPHRGEHHRLGTRYHFDDLYGHLEANELKGHTQVITALDEHNNSPWPVKFPPAHFKKIRRNSGLIIFNSQYQCDTEAMKGEVFQYDDCQELNEDDFPSTSSLKVYMGVDLAVTEEEQNDKFAIGVVGIQGSVRKGDFYVFVLDYFVEHLRPTRQGDKVMEFYDRWDPIKLAIESNQYQDSLRQTIKEKHPDTRVYKRQTSKDKMTRAWKLSALFEDKRVFFRKGVHQKAIENLVLFPAKGYRDFFDALDHAIGAAKHRKGKRKKRSSFGLL